MAKKEVSLRIRVKVAVGSVRRAFSEFLDVPIVVILAFLLLATITYRLDRTDWRALDPVREFLHAYIFSDVQATSQLLRTIAGGLMTVTSVTISILLLALQQSAGAMTTAVFDQFLRRRMNQTYFGFFVGLTVYALIILSTVNAPFNPVIGGAVALVLTIIALFLLIVLLYTTINQIRPVEIIDTIHEHTLSARRRQMDLLVNTRRQSHYTGLVQRPVKIQQRGAITSIAIDLIATAIEKADGPVEVVLTAPIGAHVIYQQEIAVVHAPTDAAASPVEGAVRKAVTVARQRDITTDPEYGIEQLVTIAWSSSSSAKSDIAPGLLTVYSLRDLLARWTDDAEAARQDAASRQPAPVVYPDDSLAQLIFALESLAVISSESLQYQIYTEVMRTFALLFDRLPPTEQQHAETVILRLLSALGDHVLTSELERALDALSARLRAAGRIDTAQAVSMARLDLGRTVGRLN